MTEQHECEWERHISPNYDPPPYIRCKHCKEPMTTTEILDRLNEYETLKKATEAFSAEDATELAGHHIPGYGLTKSLNDALQSYANILEGK